MRRDRQPGVTRRDFISTTAGTVAGAVLASRTASAQTARSARRVPGAQDRIHVAIVGTGRMGRLHLDSLLTELRARDNLEVVAVCDVRRDRCRRAQRAAGLPDARAFDDALRMFDTVKDMDAVVVATPDESHARLAIAALDAGKHVYVETPMALTLREAFALYDAKQRSGRLVQVGSRGCSAPIWAIGRSLVRSGAIGTVVWGHGSYRVVGRGAGRNVLPQRLHPLLFAMDVREFPSRVSCLGGRAEESSVGRTCVVWGCGDAPAPGGASWGTSVFAEFPSGMTIFLAAGTGGAYGSDHIIHGERADLVVRGSALRLEPRGAPTGREVPGRHDLVSSCVREARVEHMRDFVRAMRRNAEPACGVETGLRAQAILAMAEMSVRQQRIVCFDDVRHSASLPLIPDLSTSDL